MAVKKPKYGPNGQDPLDFQGKTYAEIVVLLAKTDGFIRIYWHNMRYYRYQKVLFNTLNDYYFEVFKEYRYKNYDSFRKSLAWHLRK